MTDDAFNAPLQPQPPAAPPAPSAPAAPSPTALQGPGVNIALPGAPTGPLTAEDVAALRARRSELSTQLTSAEGRREEVLEELTEATDPAVRRGLEERLRTLDDRLVQLEKDIAANGRLMASAPANLLRTTEETAPPPPLREPGPLGLSSGQTFVLSMVFIAAVLGPLAVGFSRRFFRPPPPRPSPDQAASAERLARIEEAVDAIAVEVERISEGQRFVTQLMADKAPQLQAGQAPAQPIPVREQVRAQG